MRQYAWLQKQTLLKIKQEHTKTQCCIIGLDHIIYKTRMWANAQHDGRPAEYSWCPLLNAAKFGWRRLQVDFSLQSLVGLLSGYRISSNRSPLASISTITSDPRPVFEARPVFKARLVLVHPHYELECGPLPNLMVALPNIGGALYSTPQSLADAHY